MAKLEASLPRLLALLAVFITAILSIDSAAVAQDTSSFQGRWVIGSASCSNQAFVWNVEAGQSRFVDPQGSVFLERITEWLPYGFRSITQPGSSGQGTRWEYRVVGPSSIRVSNLTRDQTFTLNRCATPARPAPGSVQSAGRNPARLGPSFDCGVARDPLSGLICGSDQLAWLDLRFVQSYQALRQQLGETGSSALRQEAIDFQMQVRGECRLPSSGAVPMQALAWTETCVVQAYQRQRDAWASRLSAPAREEADRSLPEHVALQSALAKLGYIPPLQSADGVYGPTTRLGIIAWQMASNLPPTGLMSAWDATALARAATGLPSVPGSTAPVAGMPASPPSQSNLPPAIAEPREPPRPTPAQIRAAEERQIELARLTADKARADADKAQAEADRARAEAEVFAAKTRTEAEARRKAAEQARAEQDAKGIQP